MKILAYILSFQILFLSLGPGVKDVCLVEDKTECCSDLCEPVLEEKSLPDNQPVKNDACSNPFVTCNDCSGYFFVFNFISLSPEIFYIAHHTPVTENFPSEIAIDFWQPPKIS